ncbi:hypothetical protein [Mycobacterium leprae]|uniref:hypothetical protein n=1 Tax=Mycobacterium leprae TaxID=1769 RepID=UPI0007DB6C4D|nr:hypothetical protein [Mycobacterium leprae]
MGAIDLVIQHVKAPLSVASGLQRIGRARNRVGKIPCGGAVPQVPYRPDWFRDQHPAGSRQPDRDDACSPTSPLDILDQQTVTTAVLKPLDAG